MPSPSSPILIDESMLPDKPPNKPCTTTDITCGPQIDCQNVNGDQVVSSTQHCFTVTHSIKYSCAPPSGNCSPVCPCPPTLIKKNDEPLPTDGEPTEKLNPSEGEVNEVTKDETPASMEDEKKEDSPNLIEPPLVDETVPKQEKPPVAVKPIVSIFKKTNIL